jgi:hypothetical protein
MLNRTPGLRPSVNSTPAASKTCRRLVTVLGRIFSPRSKRTIGGGGAQAPGSNPIIDMLSSPQAKAVLAGVAAMLVKRFMQGSSRTA